MGVAQMVGPAEGQAAVSLWPPASLSISRDLTIEAAVVDPLSGSTWDDAVALFADANPFHTSAWARVLSRTYEHKPFYLQLSRGDTTVGLLPLMEVASPITGLRGVTLPFSDFCSALVTETTALEVMRRKILEVSGERSWKYTEVRDATRDTSLSGDPAQSFYMHELALSPDTDKLWGGISPAGQRAIRKAASSGIHVQLENSRSALRDFFEIHAQTRRRHGVPPQPFRFFANIFEEMIATESGGHLLIARRAGRAIAGALFFEHNGFALYKFGASDYSSQGLRPNNLVMWEGIQLLARCGCSLLHLGRTEPGNDGLRRFKRGWGANETLLRYHRFGETHRAMVPTTSVHEAIFRRLPLSVNKLAGALIYPHLD